MAIVTFNCETCGKGVERRYEARRKPRFCSLQCRRSHGGTYENDGYPYTYVGHGKGRKKPYVADHIAVAEKALGRRLKKGETVHHIDGDKKNRKNTNLVICTQSYHNAMHARMSYLYQREHFG